MVSEEINDTLLNLKIVFSLALGVCVILAAIVFGWLAVWRFFLSKFKLLREIFGLPEPNQKKKSSAPPENNIRTPEPKRRSADHRRVNRVE